MLLKKRKNLRKKYDKIRLRLPLYGFSFWNCSHEKNNSQFLFAVISFFSLILFLDYVCKYVIPYHEFKNKTFTAIRYRLFCFSSLFLGLKMFSFRSLYICLPFILFISPFSCSQMKLLNACIPDEIYFWLSLMQILKLDSLSCDHCL